MRSNNTFIRQLIIAVTMLAIVTGCVKKRPPVEGQGTNLGDLVAISSLNGTFCEIKTKDVKQKLNSSAAQKVDLDTTPKYGIKVWDLVNFDSNCPVIGDNNIELMAPTNTTLKAKYEVDAKNVTLYKLVTAEQMSHLEVPYARQEGSMWKVPIGGFPVEGFFTIGWVTNSDNRNTNVQTKLPVDRKNYKSATHVAVNKTNFVTFKRMTKTDVLPKDYFKGEWFYGKTVVNRKFYSSGAGVNALSNTDANFDEANKIEFIVEKTFLVAVNANVDERLKSKDHKLNLVTALRIPIRNVDYRQKPEGVGFNLSEEEIETKTLEESRYMELTIADSQTPENFVNVEDIFGGGPRDPIAAMVEMLRKKLNGLVIMKDLIIRDDYFSFTLEDRSSETETRYSFLRVLPNRLVFEARHAYRDDMLKFGLFTSSRNRIMDDQIRTQSDIEKLTFINRFNPKSEIVYRFSTGSSKEKWVRDIAREAINIWQQAFKMAGITTTIRLDESSDQELGDIRYNIINISEGKTGSVVGYGPSLADSFTGEIISATTNLYVQSQRDGVLGKIRRYIAEKIGQRFDFTNSEQLDPALQKLKPMYLAMRTRMYDWKTGKVIANPMVYRWHMESGTDVTVQAKASTTPETLVPNDSVAYLTEGKLGTFDELYPYLAQPQVQWSGVQSGEDQFSDDDAIINRYIETAAECRGVMALVNKYKDGRGVPSTEELVEVTHPCSIPFTQFASLDSIVHEFGHNLGLRHNFMASRDKKNYVDPAAYKLKHLNIPKDLLVPKSSSIMDYYSEGNGLQIFPARYDLAALRFSYMGQVEASNGAIVSINTKKSISQNMGDNVRPYYFCTDEHQIGAGAGADAFCAQFDEGNDSSYMAYSATNSLFKALPGTYRYQLALGLWAENLGENIVGSIMVNNLVLKTHYERWRNLLNQTLGDRRKYLQGISVDEYQKIIAQLLAGPHKEEVADLLIARNKMVLGAIDLAFMPNRYCVVESSTGQELLLELSRVRQEMQRLGFSGRVASCRDQGTEAYFAASKLKLKSEAGFDLKPGAYDLDPIQQASNVDFLGIMVNRLFAMKLLTSREIGLRMSAMQNFGPSMMDEPDIREVVMTMLQTRVGNGAFYSRNKVDLRGMPKARLLNEDDVKSRVLDKQGALQRYANFSEESQLVTEMMALAYESLHVPDDFEATAERTAPYKTMVTQNPELAKDRIKNMLQLSATTYLATLADSSESFSSQMIDKVNELSQMEAFSQLSLDEVKATFKKIIDSFVSEKVALKTEGATVADMIKYAMTVQGLQQVMGSAGKGQDAQLLSMLVTPDVPIMNRILGKLSEIAEAQQIDQNTLMGMVKRFTEGEKPQDQEMQMYTILMSPLDPKMFEQGGMPDAQGLGKRAKAIATNIDVAQKIQNDSGLELDAQKNLIIQLLQIFSQ